MSGPEYPDAPPPEVPEEFADAYRDAYRRALESDDVDGELPEVPAQEVVLVGTHRSEREAGAASGHGIGEWRSAPWFLPVVVGVAAVLLVGAAYGLGVVFSSDEEPGAATPSAAHPTSSAAPGEQPATPSDREPTTAPNAWDGAVTPVTASAVSADCTAPASNDSAGDRITYDPENVVDGRTATAWRCPGTAVGEKLTLRLGGDLDIAEVALVPGYAKTDPESGVDRYAENNRITRVRWTFGDGDSFVQRLDPDPSLREMQALRIPPTTADTVTLEILSVKRGPRNTTAISEVELAAASDD
jgi:hypothetical protein